ncbi:MAG: protein kinase [Planctomycetota bacterium]|nr:protein kinase [Planctomycetota bacterium]
MGQQGEQAGTSVSGRKRLGELALEKGLISSSQLSDALKTQGELKKLGLSERIGAILYKKKALSQKALDGLLNEQTAQDEPGRPAPAKKARKLGNFELYERVGAGAMGVVFRARQITMDRIVAVKILAPKYADDESFIKRFVREARAAGQFSHENIVTALDVGFIEPYHYFVMEYVEGKTLRKVVEERGPLPENEALGFAMQIAKGLDHALTKKILHRDVKPENVIVTAQGVAKLLDMGLACTVGASEEDLAEGDPKARKAAGTPHYISPEAARGEDLDTRADLYSLGCTLYHMLAGCTPYEGRDGRTIMARQVAEPFPEIAAKRPNLSEHAVRILAKLSAKDREQRYRTPGEAIEDCDRVLRGQPPKYAAPAAPPPGKSGRMRAGSTTGPRAPIGERGTTGPRSPIRPRGTTTGPASPILGDRTGSLSPTQPGAEGGKARAKGAPPLIWLGAAAAAVVVLGLAAVLSMGGETKSAKQAPPKPAPEKIVQPEPAKSVEVKAPAEPSREQKAREALEAAQKLEAEAPGAFAAFLPALRQAAEQARETPVAKPATEALNAAQARYAKAVEDLLQKAQTDADAAAARNEWKSAVAAFPDGLLSDDLRAGDGAERLAAARKTVLEKAEARAAKFLAEARAKAQPATPEALAEAITLAGQAEEVPSEFAPSAKLAAEERTAWTAALERLKVAAAQQGAERAAKARAYADAVRKELQPLLQSNRLSAAREALAAKLREAPGAEAAEALKAEQADLDALAALRKEAIEALRNRAGEKVTLTKGASKLSGTIKNEPGAPGVSLKMADGPEFALGPEQLDAADADAYAPPKAGEAAREDFRRRGLLFMAAGDFARAGAFFTQARDAGLGEAQRYLDRLEVYALGEKEVAARKAWTALEELFATKRWKEIKRALEGYKDEFGATKWAAEKQAPFLAMLNEATAKVLFGNLPSQGLKLWLRLDEGKGASAANAAGQGETTLQGATWAQGKFDGALAFDGNRQFAVTAADLKDRFLSEDVSISIWFNAAAAGVVITEIGSADLNGGWHDSQVEVLASGEVKVRVWNLEGVSLGTVKFNEWHHAVLVYDKTAQTLTGYLDGTKAAAETKGARQVPWKNNQGLFYALGAADSTNLGSGAFFKGLIDEVRIYDRPLGAEEAKALAAARADAAK